MVPLRGYCTSYQKLACFMLYFKIINNFWKIKYASCKKNVQGTQNGIDILVQVGQADFKLLIKTSKMFVLDQ